jgi:hypothetical protein
MNKLRVSRHLSERDDDLFSNGEIEDSQDNYINKKQLIHLENDKSVTIDESLVEQEIEGEYYSRISRRRSDKPDKVKKIDHHDELIKFINDDTSDIFGDGPNTYNMNQINSLNMPYNQHPNWNFTSSAKSLISPINARVKTEQPLTLNKFEIFLPADMKASSSSDKDKYFTLQNQSHSSNSYRNSTNANNMYKEKLEATEMKYKDLYENYNNLLEAIKEWQMFYIQVFSTLNMPLPVNKPYNEAFNEKYKQLIVCKIENMMNLMSKVGQFENLNVLKEISLNLEKIEKKEEKVIKPKPIPNRIENICRLNITSSKKSIQEFNFSNFKFVIENSISLLGQIKKVQPKPNKIFEDEDFNNLAPFSARGGALNNLPTNRKDEQDTNILQSQKSPIKINSKKENISNNIPSTNNQSQFINPLIISTNLSYEINSIPKPIHTQPAPKINKLYPQSFYLLIPSKSIAPKRNSEAQTTMNCFDIDRLNALNEEYGEQMMIYKDEKEEIEKIYTLEVDKLRHELNQCKKSASNVMDMNTLYLPEMIPPDQTFKIFLRKKVRFIFLRLC